MKITTTPSMKIRRKKSINPSFDSRTKGLASKAEAEVGKGSVLLGAFWTSLLIFVGWVVGMKIESPGTGFMLGAVLGFIVAYAKHKGRGIAGAVLASVVIIPLLCVVEGQKASNRAYHDALKREVLM